MARWSVTFELQGVEDQNPLEVRPARPMLSVGVEEETPIEAMTAGQRLLEVLVKDTEGWDLVGMDRR